MSAPLASHAEPHDRPCLPMPLDCQRDVGLIQECIASYTKCLELIPDSRNAGQNRLLALNYIIPGDHTRVAT